MTDLPLFIELFPIDPAAIPPLTAYRVEFSGDEPPLIGGRLAHRLGRAFSGQWVWVDGHIVTDNPRTVVELLITLDIIRAEQPDFYAPLQAIDDAPDWQPDARTQAEFVVRTRLRALDNEMRAALTKATIKVRNAQVEREPKLQAWAVAGQPALSLSIASRLVYEWDLHHYAQGVNKPKDLIGMFVADKTSGLAGEVISIVGRVSEHRARLLDLTQREVMQGMLQLAGDDELVVRVQSGVYEYDYPASALRVLIRTLGDNEELHHFDIDPVQIMRALRIKPAYRSQLVKGVSDTLKAAGLIANAYNSREIPDVFLHPAFEANLVFDKNQVRPYNARDLGDDFAHKGVYHRLPKFDSEPIRIAIVNTLPTKIDDFIEALRRQLEKQFGFKIEMIRERKVKVVNRKNLESAVKVVEEENPHIVLAFVEDQDTVGSPGGIIQEDLTEDDTARILKSLTLGKGIASHVIRPATMDRPEAMPTIIMGILGKTGTTPFVLAEPLEYCDFVVGLDIVREHTKEGDTLTAIARIYRSDGMFVRYAIRSMKLESEGVFYVLMRDLFPQREFAKKRVIIHHDGALSANERDVLSAWSQAIKASFSLVEILKFNVPRLYSLDGGKVGAPPWGSAFRVSDTEAFLVSSSMGPEEGTPQPLHVRLSGATASLSIELALHSVLVWTMLHYGTFLPPRLPVTVQYSDEISQWLAKGMLPKTPDGDVPFWL